jgi:drug/metabolite transporter (DMT)-like permease
MARWRLPAAPTAAAIAVTCGLLYGPVHIVAFGLIDLPLTLLAEQFFYQSMMGGGLSFIMFAATVSRLGAVRAALFFAMVPPCAAMFAVPMMGTIPTGLEVVAFLCSSVGIIVSLELRATKRRLAV